MSHLQHGGETTTDAKGETTAGDIEAILLLGGKVDDGKVVPCRTGTEAAAAGVAAVATVGGELTEVTGEVTLGACATGRDGGGEGVVTGSDFMLAGKVFGSGTPCNLLRIR